MGFIRAIKSFLVALSAGLFSVDNGAEQGYIRVLLALPPPRSSSLELLRRPVACALKNLSEGEPSSMRKLISSLAIASLAFTMTGCSEKAKNPVGFGLVEDDNHWQTSQVVIEDVLADSCLTLSTGAGDGYHLLIGSWEGQETRSLLLFEELPDTLLWPLIEAKLILTSYSQANEDSLIITAHSLQSGWQEEDVTWEHPWIAAGGDFESEAIAEGSYALISADGLELNFTGAGVQLVQGWLQGQTNNGLILRAADLQENNLKYFYTTNTLVYSPRLELTFSISDTSDTTVSAEASQDAFIVQLAASQDEDLLCVSDGTVRRSWIHFDVSTVPESVFVNKASLALSVSEFSAPLNSMTIAAYQVTDLETLAFSPGAAGSANLFSGKELLEINLTGLVQSWIKGIQNAGLILKVPTEYNDLSRALFFTSLADSLQRPRLTILYTTSPSQLARSATGDEIP